MSNETKIVWKNGKASEIDSLFGASVGGAVTTEFSHHDLDLSYDTGQIALPEWLAAFIDEGDFENALKIIKKGGWVINNQNEVPPMIRAIQRTAALDALREYFHGKAREILEKGGGNGR